MPYTTILFYVLALIIVVSAAMVVFNKNVVHSAFSLFFTLFAISGFYVLLKADFIALTQIMVYVGGILILLIFGVMMTTKVTNVELKTKNLNTIPSLVFSIGIVTILIFVIFSTKWNIRLGLDSEETVTQIGIMLLSKYLLPFEIASIVLLVALIGSAMFARRIKD